MSLLEEFESERQLEAYVQGLKDEIKELEKEDQVWRNIANDLTNKCKGLTEALEQIAKPTYGTEIWMDDEEIAKIYWQHITTFQYIAKKAVEAHGLRTP